MSLCQRSFFLAFSSLSQTYVGHIAGRGRKPPRKGTGGSSLLPPGPHRLISHPVSQICWVGGSSQARRESCWSAEPPPARRELRDPHTHSLVCCPEPAAGQSWTCSRHGSKEHLTDTCPDRDPLLPPLPAPPPSLCQIWCLQTKLQLQLGNSNGNWQLDGNSSSTRLLQG